MPEPNDLPKKSEPPKKAPSEKEWTKSGAKSPDDFPEGEDETSDRQPAEPQRTGRTAK